MLLAQVLANKALVLSRHSSDVDNMAKALCSLITDAVLNNPETLRNAPAKFSRSEFQQYVFRVLACLASYHAHLMPDVQQRLLKGLDVGLKYKGLNFLVPTMFIRGIFKHNFLFLFVKLKKKNQIRQRRAS